MCRLVPSMRGELKEAIRTGENLDQFRLQNREALGVKIPASWFSCYPVQDAFLQIAIGCQPLQTKPSTNQGLSQKTGCSSAQARQNNTSVGPLDVVSTSSTMAGCGVHHFYGGLHSDKGILSQCSRVPWPQGQRLRCQDIILPDACWEGVCQGDWKRGPTLCLCDLVCSAYRIYLPYHPSRCARKMGHCDMPEDWHVCHWPWYIDRYQTCRGHLICWWRMRNMSQRHLESWSFLIFIFQRWRKIAQVQLLETSVRMLRKNETITDTIKMLCGYSTGQSLFVVRSKVPLIGRNPINIMQ